MGVGSFDTFFKSFDDDSGKRGKQWEVACKWFLENDGAYSELEKVWLWDDWPRYTFYVEGFATGLSVMAALEKLGSGDSSQVVVCFTAGNLQKVAAPGGMVIADNDSSRTGEVAARATGLSYWSPPDVDTDANDYHQRYGLDALAKALAG